MHNNLKRINGAIINIDPSVKNKIRIRKEKEKRLDMMEEKLNKIENLLIKMLEKNG